MLFTFLSNGGITTLCFLLYFAQCIRVFAVKQYRVTVCAYQLAYFFKLYTAITLIVSSKKKQTRHTAQCGAMALASAGSPNQEKRWIAISFHVFFFSLLLLALALTRLAGDVGYFFCDLWHQKLPLEYAMNIDVCVISCFILRPPEDEFIIWHAMCCLAATIAVPVAVDTPASLHASHHLAVSAARILRAQKPPVEYI